MRCDRSTVRSSLCDVGNRLSYGVYPGPDSTPPRSAAVGRTALRDRRLVATRRRRENLRMSENSLESQLGARLAFTGALGGRRCDAAAVSRSEGFGTRPAGCFQSGFLPLRSSMPPAISARLLRVKTPTPDCHAGPH